MKKSRNRRRKRITINRSDFEEEFLISGDGVICTIYGTNYLVDGEIGGSVETMTTAKLYFDTGQE